MLRTSDRRQGLPAARPTRFPFALLGAALIFFGAVTRADQPAPSPAPAKASATDAAKAKPTGPHPLPDALPQQANFVQVVLDDEVTLGMAAFVDRVARALRQGDILLIELKTFGGRIDAAVRIRDTLISCRERSVFTVAYIEPRAISAGALIAYATDVIVVAPGATMGAAAPVQLGEGGESKAAGEKVVSYMRQEMRATAEARGRQGEIAAAMVDPDIEIPDLIAKGKLLTLDGKQALAWGVASFEARNLHELYTKLGYSADAQPGEKSFTVTTQQWTWAERLVAWISSVAVSSLLMTIGMLGLMIGLYTGGSPVPLSVGAICLALFFFGHYAVNLAGFEDLLIFGLGVLLILVEFFIPGYIIPGVLGVVCIIAALFMGLVDFKSVPFRIQWEAGWIRIALTTLFGSVLAASVLGALAARFLPRTRLAGPLVLSTALTGRATDRSLRQRDQSSGVDSDLVGATGRADTDLRPAGAIVINGQRFDALAEANFIEAGSPVCVIRRQGFELIVKVVHEETPAKGEESHG